MASKPSTWLGAFCVLAENSMTKITKESLKNHWWFRLLKIIYLFAIGLSLVIVTDVGADERPVLNKSASVYQFKCNNEKTYRGNLSGNSLSFGYSNKNKPTFLYDHDVQSVRFICANPSITQENFSLAFEEAKTKGTIPSYNNFEIVIKDPVYNGIWLDVFKFFTQGILWICVIAWVIKIVFMYILIGETPKISIKEKILKFRKNKDAIQTEADFTPKVTFKNSFVWYLLGLILFAPIAYTLRVLITITLDFFGADVTTAGFQDIKDLSWVVSLVLIVILVNKIVRRRQINKHRKQNSA